MRIISKYKDYYDYLQGIYGIDEKLILDRTGNFATPERFRTNVLRYKHNRDLYEIVRFWICGRLIEGLFNIGTGIFLYGEDLKELASNDKVQGTGKFRYYINQHKSDTDFFWYINLPQKRGWTKVAKYPIPFEIANQLNRRLFDDIKKPICPNDAEQCPILYDAGFNVPNYVKFPILSDFEFHKVYSAHDLWILLAEWLGREKEIPNNQTNEEKIISNGFDLKSSFRHPIK